MVNRDFIGNDGVWFAFFPLVLSLVGTECDRKKNPEMNILLPQSELELDHM